MAQQKPSGALGSQRLQPQPQGSEPVASRRRPERPAGTRRTCCPCQVLPLPGTSHSGERSYGRIGTPCDRRDPPAGRPAWTQARRPGPRLDRVWRFPFPSSAAAPATQYDAALPWLHPSVNLPGPGSRPSPPSLAPDPPPPLPPLPRSIPSARSAPPAGPRLARSVALARATPPSVPLLLAPSVGRGPSGSAAGEAWSGPLPHSHPRGRRRRSSRWTPPPSLGPDPPPPVPPDPPPQLRPGARAAAAGGPSGGRTVSLAVAPCIPFAHRLCKGGELLDTI
ncbi:hypothetical protein SETIT_7G087600v2 [Setaria italica]|uniref:Uncharacterized protein n=1 Tax=Setaria italica TaxID=4555 RepID=A0A368RTP4_SETIT|nr:hypothetical protein SETIT_7G087600v2 [Setaria italica]